MKKLFWTLSMVALLGTVPAFAQDGYRDHEQRRATTVVHGTVQAVQGTQAVLQIPTAVQSPYGTQAGPLVTVDVSEATFENPDGTPAPQQQLVPGERVIVVLRSVPTYQQQPQQQQPYYPPQQYPNPQYPNPPYQQQQYPQYPNGQYNPQQYPVPQQSYGPVSRALVVEPLNF